MSAPPGAPPCVTLAGYPLVGIAAPQVEVKRREIKTVVESGNGSAREHLAHRDPGYPVRTHRYSFRVAYSHLREKEGLIEGILSGPGPHTFCLWKPEHLRYTPDGVRQEFYFDRPVAIHTLTPPSGYSSAVYAPEISFGLTSVDAVLTYAVVSEGTYGAGSPPTGTVWFVSGARKFKLAAAPAAGSVLVARIVSLYSVLEQPDVDKRYSRPIAEPRDLNLVEA